MIAAELLASSQTVILVDRNTEALRSIEMLFRKEHGERLQTLVADLSTIDGVREAAHAMMDAGVGGLVNNAGGWLPGEQYPLAPTETWLHSRLT